MSRSRNITIEALNTVNVNVCFILVAVGCPMHQEHQDHPRAFNLFAVTIKMIRIVSVTRIAIRRPEAKNDASPPADAPIAARVEYFFGKIPSTNLGFTCDQSGYNVRDKDQIPLRNRGVFLDKHWVSTKCETFHTQNVKRFTFFPQGKKLSPW
jgi:hypothetical protein